MDAKESDDTDVEKEVHPAEAKEVLEAGDTPGEMEVEETDSDDTRQIDIPERAKNIVSMRQEGTVHCPGDGGDSWE